MRLSFCGNKKELKYFMEFLERLQKFEKEADSRLTSMTYRNGWTTFTEVGKQTYV